MPLKSSVTILETRKWYFKYFAKGLISRWVPLRKDSEVCLTGFYCMSLASFRLKKEWDVNHAKLLATIRFRIQRINGQRKSLDTATSSTFHHRRARDVNNYRLRVSVLVFWITRRSEGMVIVIGQNLLWQHNVFFTINVKNAIASLFYFYHHMYLFFLWMELVALAVHTYDCLQNRRF